MIINSSRNDGKYNIPDGLRPLFDDMNAGRTIKKIVCYAGQINKNDPSKDFTIENFKALEYWVGIGVDGKTGEYRDYVDTNVSDSVSNLASIPGTINMQHKSFYMNWVKSFELHEYIQLLDGSEVELKDPNELFAS